MILLLLAALTTLAAIAFVAGGGAVSVLWPLAFIWTLTAFTLLPPLRALKARLTAPFRWLRAHPARYWLALLLLALLLAGRWLWDYQPVWGKSPAAGEWAFLGGAAWLWFWLASFGTRPGDGRAMGAALAKSRATGPLLSASTLALLLLAVELWMRAALVISDGFSFTAMNYWWNALHWQPINSLGYRDAEPNSDPTQQQILAVGDSFVAGHGIENIADSFPHVLDRLLADYTVNIVAQRGWETDDQLAPLDSYPRTPDVVVLSHYFNDLSYALAQNPVRVALPPDWIEPFIRQYFLPNFLYWHVFQFGIEGHGGEYVRLLLDAYQDDQIWTQHAWHLQSFVDWAAAHDARLVVIVWPALNALEESAAAAARVAAFFTERGIAVVNMDDALRGRDPATLIVNPFDTHPNVATHALAAQLLAQTIESVSR